MSEPRFFKSGAEFRKWLAKNHKSQDELLVGFTKRSADKSAMTYHEALDQALAYGWIDGVRKSYDADRYTIRFTPRRKRSIWSAVNIKRVGELTELDLMEDAGLEVFKNRDPKRQNIYSFEQSEHTLAPEYEKLFKKNKAAWAYFTSEAPWYQRVVKHWIMTAKREETRARRLATLIADSEAGRRIGMLNNPKGKK